MSFEIIEGTYRNTGGSGYLLGFKNYHSIVDQLELDNEITIMQADDMKEKYDGYQLQVDGYDSVNYFLGGNIEAICLHSATAGGGHCAGLLYSTDEDRKDEGDPWGIWFTTEQF